MTNEVEITITADDLTGPAFASVMRRLAALKAAARDANSEFGSIGLSDFSLSRMNSSLTALKAKIQSLGIADIADVNVPTGRLMTQMQLLKRLIQQAGISDLLDINANTAGLMSQLSKLRGLTEEVPVRYFVQGGPGAGPPSLISADITDRFSVMGLAVADQQLAALSNISAQLSKTVNTEAVPAAYALGRGWGWAGNAFALAGTKLKLFGGNLGAIPLLGSITGFHLLADAVFEVGAVVIPAAVGLAAFGAASIPTFQGVYQQMSNLNTVSSALGVNLPGVSGGFQSISDAVQPKALQLFGDALYIANQRSDLFRQLALSTGNAVDTLANRFTVAVTNGDSFSKFLHNASGDVLGLGNVVGNLGGVLGNVLQEVPGYAQYFLNFAVGITHVAEDASAAARPLIGLGLAAHGALIYTGLAATVLQYALARTAVGVGNLALKAGTALTKTDLFGEAGTRAGISILGLGEDAAGVAGFLAGGWGLATIAAGVGLGILIDKLVTTQSAAQQFINQVSAKANAATGSNIFTALGYEISGLQSKLGGLNTSLTQGGSATATRFRVRQADVLGIPVQALQGYVSQIKNAQAEELRLNQRTDQLATAFGSLGAAQGLIIASGVKLGDLTSQNAKTFAAAWVQIMATADAYREMGVFGGLLGADLNALNIAASGQVTDMQSVNTAWTTTIGIVSGGQTGFVAFQRALAATGAAAKAAGASMNGLNAPSLNLRGNFQQTLTQASGLLNALRMMSSVSPGGFPPVTRAIGDVISELIPLASKSAATRAELVSLAAEAGKNVTNWGQLTKDFGGNRNAASDLNKQLASMGLNIQDLSKDAAALSTTMNANVSTAFSAARLKATGVTGAVNQLAQDMSTDRGRVHDDSIALYGDLLHAGYGAQAAASLVSELSGQLFRIPKNVYTKVSLAGAAAVIGEAAAVGAALGGLNGMTATTYVNTVRVGASPGGPTGHKAGGGYASGWTWVGEMGAELVNLPSGSRVYDNSQSAQMAATGGRTPVVVNFNFQGSRGTTLETALKSWIRQTVAIEGGGDVQVTFGGNL